MMRSKVLKETNIGSAATINMSVGQWYMKCLQ